jgi:hypothetical protein
MSAAEPQPAVPKPRRCWYQYSLRVFLFLFVMLGTSLAVFGAWGIAAFGLVLGLTIFVRHVSSLWLSAIYAVLAGLCLLCLGAMVHGPAARRPPNRFRCLAKLHQIVLALQAYEQAHGSLVNEPTSS